MTDVAVVTDFRFTRAPLALRSTGLLGWLWCVIDHDHALDGFVVRRTQQGHIEVFWPARKATNGREHPIYRPLSPAKRASIMRQAREWLDRRGVLT